MKNTVIITKVDESGRLQIPIKMRKAFGINNDGINDSRVEILTEGDSIIIKKFIPHCLFCDSSDNLVFYEDKKICKACIEKIKKI